MSGVRKRGLPGSSPLLSMCGCSGNIARNALFLKCREQKNGRALHRGQREQTEGEGERLSETEREKGKDGGKKL